MKIFLALLLLAPQSADAGGVTRELTHIEQQLAASWKNGDCDAWSAWIASEWSVIHIDGSVITKADALKTCKAPQSGSRRSPSMTSPFVPSAARPS